MTRPADDGPPSGTGRDPRRPASSSRPRSTDLAGDVQRWLIKSGARNMRREFGEQVRRVLGGPQPQRGNVWEVATTEPPPGERFDSPECAWCPICRAARRARESGPGLGSQLSGASDRVAAAVADALSAFDAVLSAGSARSGPGRSGPGRSGPGRSGPGRSGPGGSGSARPAPDRPVPDPPGPESPGPDRPGPDRPRSARPGPDEADGSVWATAVRDPAAADTTVPQPARRPEEEPADEPDDRG